MKDVKKTEQEQEHSSVGRVEVKHLLSELHTNLVRVRATPAPKYFQSGRCFNLSECMWCGCRRADPVVSQAYPGIPRYVLTFRSSMKPLTTPDLPRPIRRARNLFFVFPL